MIPLKNELLFGFLFDGFLRVLFFNIKDTTQIVTLVNMPNCSLIIVMRYSFDTPYHYITFFKNFFLKEYKFLFIFVYF